jgi:murein DD-endopeptidase MepM/ murein hydrolase activator NlpD
MDFSWPLDHNRIRGGLKNHTFGMVRRYPNGKAKPHQGWDFEAAVGTPCFAVAAGQVVSVTETPDYGKQLCLAFQIDGVKRWAFYAHLDEVSVSAGEAVALGAQVGRTGRTGNAETLEAAEDHLHFELRTRATPRSGLLDRVSPNELFGVCPMSKPVLREGSA